MNAANALLPIVLVPATLQVVFADGRWQATFAGESAGMPNADGDFDFSGHDKQFQVVITLKDSAGIRFLADADLCIGFDKKACPKTSVKDDKDVFLNVAISQDQRSLSFLNRNPERSGKFYYALFLHNGAGVIPIDPRIINR